MAGILSEDRDIENTKWRNEHNCSVQLFAFTGPVASERFHTLPEPSSITAAQVTFSLHFHFPYLIIALNVCWASLFLPLFYIKHLFPHANISFYIIGPSNLLFIVTIKTHTTILSEISMHLLTRCVPAKWELLATKPSLTFV